MRSGIKQSKISALLIALQGLMSVMPATGHAADSCVQQVPSSYADQYCAGVQPQNDACTQQHLLKPVFATPAQTRTAKQIIAVHNWLCEPQSNSFLGQQLSALDQQGRDLSEQSLVREHLFTELNQDATTNPVAASDLVTQWRDLNCQGYIQAYSLHSLVRANSTENVESWRACIATALDEFNTADSLIICMFGSFSEVDNSLIEYVITGFKASDGGDTHFDVDLSNAFNANVQSRVTDQDAPSQFVLTDACLAPDSGASCVDHSIETALLLDVASVKEETSFDGALHKCDVSHNSDWYLWLNAYAMGPMSEECAYFETHRIGTTPCDGGVYQQQCLDGTWHNTENCISCSHGYQHPDFNLCALPFFEVSNKLSIDGMVHSCSIEPALPEGLKFDETTCRISGNVKTEMETTRYEITGQTSCGEIKETVNITVENCDTDSDIQRILDRRELSKFEMERRVDIDRLLDIKLPPLNPHGPDPVF